MSDPYKRQIQITRGFGLSTPSGIINLSPGDTSEELIYDFGTGDCFMLDIDGCAHWVHAHYWRYVSPLELLAREA